jgi:hypothetical protein
LWVKSKLDGGQQSIQVFLPLSAYRMPAQDRELTIHLVLCNTKHNFPPRVYVKSKTLSHSMNWVLDKAFVPLLPVFTLRRLAILNCDSPPDALQLAESAFVDANNFTFFFLHWLVYIQDIYPFQRDAHSLQGLIIHLSNII